MPKNCPRCVRAIEELVQEIRTMATRDHLASNVAAKMENELQEAIAESKKDTPDLKSILRKLNGAKTLIDDLAPASGLLNNFAETKTLIKRYLP